MQKKNKHTLQRKEYCGHNVVQMEKIDIFSDLAAMI